MIMKVIPFLSILLILKGSLCAKREFCRRFKFGTATSAYQVEGAWNETGKGRSNWDYFTQYTKVILDGSNGNIACDSYHKYKEDIENLKQLGVDHYRFSISMPRLLPTGEINIINKAGVEYYNNLINELIKAGIEPWVTIHNWDLPRSLDLLGGWYNIKISDMLVEYADLLFSLYGDRVKTWITINEPDTFCRYHPLFFVTRDVYFQDLLVGTAEYLCAHNCIKVHASIYRLYERKYKKKQQGRLTLAISFQEYVPASHSRADIAAAEKARQFGFGWFAHPLVYGDYPPIMMDTIGRYSVQQGLEESRLPKFTKEEVEFVKGTYDFVGVNHFVSYLVSDNRTVSLKNPSYANDIGNVNFNPVWLANDSLRIQVYATGLGAILRWIHSTYNAPEIVILQVGYNNDKNDSLTDNDRVQYFELSLNTLYNVINEGINVTGYTIWSLMDSFEWTAGYVPKLGLYKVDFSDPNRPRTPKKSAKYFTNFLKTRTLG